MGKLDKVLVATDCTHPYWPLTENNIGECPLCGERRQFPHETNERTVVLKKGISLTASDPRELPKERKQAIATMAKDKGIEFVMKATGLPMTAIRAWVGAYARDPEKCKERLALRREARGQVVTDPPAPAAAPAPLPAATTTPAPDPLPAVLLVSTIIRKRGKYLVYSP